MIYHLGQQRLCNGWVQLEQFRVCNLQCAHVRAIRGDVKLLENLIVLLENISNIFMDIAGEIVVSDGFANTLDNDLNHFSRNVKL